MTDDPIDLDGRRTAEGQHESRMRRRPVGGHPPAESRRQPDLEDIEDKTFADPARTWLEVMEKCRFLLERYAETPEARDARIRTLIDRALGDMERLRKREERE